MWKHYPKSQIVLAQKIQSKSFIYLKYKVLWVWLFGSGVFLVYVAVFKTSKYIFFSFFLLPLSLRYDSYMKENKRIITLMQDRAVLDI